METTIKAGQDESSPRVERTHHMLNRLALMRPSAIRAIHNLGVDLQQASPQREFIALHFGEGDLGTPEFIVEAGVKALRDGAVFYENNGGRADLTQELAAHYKRLYDIDLAPGQFVVTCGGVQAIALTMLGLLSPGSEVINITPSWPNLRESAVIAGADVHDLPLRFHADAGVFRLDFDALESQASKLSRLDMVVANTPSNPTGYVMSVEEKTALLAFCRHHGAVLLADEMYDRLLYTDEAPSSFLQLKEAGDKMVLINGFSKAYSMTGWRLGYLVAEEPLARKLAEMQEFITSCAPAMAQVAAVTALREGESYVEENRLRYLGLRNLALNRLNSLPGVQVARPDGAFYAFFQVSSCSDSLSFCQDLLRETGVLLAPGVAFGQGGEGWLRLCFAKNGALLEKAIDRLGEFLVNRID